MVALTDFLVFLCNSCQPLGNVEELFLAGRAVPFQSSAHGYGREQQLTKLIGGCHDLQGNCEAVLLVDHWHFGLRPSREWLGDVHVNHEA